MPSGSECAVLPCSTHPQRMPQVVQTKGTSGSAVQPRLTQRQGMLSSARWQTHLSQAVGCSHAHKVFQGQQLRDLAGVVVAHSLQDELALGHLHTQPGLLVLCKEGLQAVVGSDLRCAANRC